MKSLLMFVFDISSPFYRACPCSHVCLLSAAPCLWQNWHDWGLKLQRNLYIVKILVLLTAMKTCQRAVLPLVKRMHDDIFIPEHQQKWLWGLGHLASSSTEQRTMPCWDGAFSRSGTHPSCCSAVLSTPWYNGNAVSPEHAGCSCWWKLCRLQPDGFLDGRGALPTGKEVCRVTCCSHEWAAAYAGPSSLETEIQDII